MKEAEKLVVDVKPNLMDTESWWVVALAPTLEQIHVSISDME